MIFLKIHDIAVEEIPLVYIFDRDDRRGVSSLLGEGGRARGNEGMGGDVATVAVL